MDALSDAAVARLRDAAGRPDLSATKYELREVVGRGAMGEVWRVFDRDLRREVALKVVSLPEADGADGERLWREARILAGLEHPGLVPVHDVGLLPDGRAYYAMKLVRGRRLDEHLSGEPSLAARLAVFERTCEAVAFAHSHGVLHRDLKPENVMVGPFGEVLVMDWGVAKVRTEGGAERTGTDRELTGPPRTGSGTEAGTVIGTRGYMAPEQARGEAASERSDVHALGAILHDLLGGRPKTDGSRGELSRSVPPALRAVCRKALSPEASARYAAAGELVADVRHFAAGEPVVAWPEGPWRRLRRIARRYRTPLLLVLAYLAMRVALAFWAWR